MTHSSRDCHVSSRRCARARRRRRRRRRHEDSRVALRVLGEASLSSFGDDSVRAIPNERDE